MTMKVSIRIKFFIILLAFSLGPLLLSRSILSRQAGRLTATISGNARDELLDIVSAELEHNAMSLLKILELSGETMSIGVRMLALEVEHQFSHGQKGGTTKSYRVGDFETASDAPPDLSVGKSYQTRTVSGKTRPFPFSLEFPAFKLPPPEEHHAFGPDEDALKRVVPTMKQLYAELTDNSQWFNIGLESGVFMTYPGHGHFPMQYDHREQQWYRRTRHSIGEVSWTAPGVDPSTRRAIASVSYPIRDRHGAFLGAASIDVPVSHLITDATLKSRWSDEIMSFMVIRYPGDTVANDGLLIIAQQSYDDGGRRHWMSGIEPEWMQSDDPEAFGRLLVAMNESESGVMQLPYKGRPCMWAFASNPDLSFLLIAPKSVIAELPDQVAGSMEFLFGRIRNISAFISGIMLIITGIMAWLGSRAVTKPLLLMADAVKRLAGGDFSARVTMKMGDERDELVDSLNEMGPKLQERLHLRRDMHLARGVQKLLLPQTEPVIAGYDISGGISYCEQTGGDYYDFIEVASPSGRAMGVVLGDVSGHGVPSALVMATARGQLHSLSQVLLTPRERVEAINTFLSRDLDGTGRFLTLFYLRLIEGSPNIRWVRAGHEPAIRYTPSSDHFSTLAGDGLALGVLEGFVFQDYQATLSTGEVLVLATDGVWEARDAKGEMFGKQRMLAIIRQNAHKSSEEIRLALMTAVGTHHGKRQEDDIAVVVIKKD
ncbi:SpoIIE family protein phosphatase [Pseudodesulfovibrio piezophilus]|nr:SpoIIE family protein phosphatase [Pseudodesulfovibrio piezophilus]